jgi:hypothetical protein
MRTRTSSPGVSGQMCGAMSVGPDNPATAYGRRHQGLHAAGAGGRGPAEKQETENWVGRPKAALLNLIRRNK